MATQIGARAAIITGASSGIGAELARQLAAAGVRVGLTARRAGHLDAVAESIRAAGGTAIVAPADASDREATRSAISALDSALGGVDLLVANAGVGLANPARAYSAEPLAETLAVNLLGPATAIEAVLPGMISRGRGRIVGVSSLAGYRGLPGSADYSASKAGLTALLQGLRVELAPRGVSVTIVHPGYVRTPMIEGSTRPMFLVLDLDPAVRRIIRGIASGRPEINFPAPTALLATLGRLLPPRLSDRLVRRIIGPE